MAKDADDVLNELRAIKALLMLQLLRQGARQSQIAAALGVSERTVGRMLPKGLVKGAARGAAVVAEELE